jgi:recombination protein RecA
MSALHVVESSPDMVSNLRLGKQDAVRWVLGDDRLQTVVPASRLSVRPRPLTVSTGIAELDALAGGLPRGALTEVVGPASSGRSSVLLSVLAAATAREEVCALVDTDDAFDPKFAVVAGVDLKRLLWVRCGEEKNVPRFEFQVSRESADSIPTASADKRETRKEKRSFGIDAELANEHSKLETRNSKLESRKREFRRIEQALKSADLLLQSGGFGVIVIDLAGVPPRIARRIPLTSWFRFRRAVENTPAVLLVLEQEPSANSCASLVVKLGIHGAPGAIHVAQKQQVIGEWESVSQSPPAHTKLLTGMKISAEVMHDRTERKPVRSAIANFDSKATWAG